MKYDVWHVKIKTFIHICGKTQIRKKLQLRTRRYIQYISMYWIWSGFQAPLHGRQHKAYNINEKWKCFHTLKQDTLYSSTTVHFYTTIKIHSFPRTFIFRKKITRAFIFFVFSSDTRANAWCVMLNNKYCLYIETRGAIDIRHLDLRRCRLRNRI